MKYLIFTLLLAVLSTSVYAQKAKTAAPAKKVIYTYKKYEKFDFDDLNIEGDTSSYGEISISPMQERSFKNKLPYKKSFNDQIKKGIQRVR